jgi:glycosyltransferase involved in cell wall biosynthesis
VEKDILKTRWLFKNVDYLLIHYESNVEKLRQLGLRSNNISVIYHPIYDTYPNTIDQYSARKKLGIPPDKKVLLSFGQIRKYKGLNYFIEALKQLGNEYYGLVVGEGKDKKIVNFLKREEKEMNNLILIEKFVPQEEIQVYMNASDVVVLPYIEISTSGVALLAYAFARPVISTDVGCMREVITTETGILAEPKNPKALANAVKEIFRKNYKEMGRKAQKIAEEKYSWDAMIGKVIESYQRLLRD